MTFTHVLNKAIKGNQDLLNEMKEFLSYDKETGLFTWIKKPNNKSPNIHIGVPLTRVNSNGYLSITFKDKTYKTHRLAWLFVYGYLPTYHLDHISGVGSDNRISNLREATSSQNGMNRGMQSNNTSGYKGVSFIKEIKKWRARVIVNKKERFLGIFDTPDLAHNAYQQYAKKVFGEFYRD